MPDPSETAATAPPAALEANERGVALMRQGRTREAAAAFAEACEHHPGYAEAFSNLGATLRRLGDLDGAIARFRTAVRLRPAFAAAHYNLGNALSQQGETLKAIDAYRNALSARPDYPEVWNNLARLLNESDRHADALDACRRGQKYAPDDANLRNNAGNALKGLGRIAEAIAEYRRAIQVAPGMGEAHSNLGLALKEHGDLEAALAAHRRAAELRPRDAATLNNLGTTLQAAGRIDEAIRMFGQAHDLDPAAPGALVNLGTAEMDRNRVDAAIDCFARAIALPGPAKEHALAHKNLGISMFSKGNFKSGSEHYAWRWKTREFRPRGYRAPQWDGAPFPGKTLFVHTEQGFGDAIQMARFAAATKARGSRVLWEAPAALAPLLVTAEGIDGLVAEHTPPPAFDLFVPLFDLLGALDVTLATIPRDGPYLSVDPARRERWEDRIPDTGHRRIGLVWAGRPTHRNDRNRSIPLDLMRPLLRIRGNDFYSLQVGDRSGDLRRTRLHDDVIDLSGWLTDFAETAAALERIDLLISADTAVVHLAGALGRPVWALIPFAPDWRWMLGRDNSPWYPALRLFRQHAPGDWPGAIERVRAALAG